MAAAGCVSIAAAVAIEGASRAPQLPIDESAFGERPLVRQKREPLRGPFPLVRIVALAEVKDLVALLGGVLDQMIEQQVARRERAIADVEGGQDVMEPIPPKEAEMGRHN